MRAAAMTVLAVGAGDGGGGALSVVQVHCSSDTKQSVYKVAAAFAAEKAQPEGDEGDGGGRDDGNSALR